jgi:hypothetical protein
MDSMNLSISLSSNEILAQLKKLLNIAIRKYNMSILFNNNLGLHIISLIISYALNRLVV